MEPLFSNSMTFCINDASTESLAGAPKVWVTIKENPDGTLQIDVWQEGGIIGDLQGLFFDLHNEKLLNGLYVEPTDGLTEVQVKNDGVSNLGDGVNMNGLLGGSTIETTADGTVDGAKYDVGI